RDLAASSLARGSAVGPVQSGIEPGEHVINAHLCAALLFPFEALTDPPGRVPERWLRRVRQRGQPLLQGGHVIQCRTDARRQVQLYAFLAGITQPFVGKALEVVAVLEFQLADAVAPGPQLSETRLVNGRLELVAVEVAGCAGLFIKRLQLLQP